MDGRQAGKGTARRKRRYKPPRPTRMTWCEECGRAGLRYRESDPVDEACRYCGGAVKVRHYPTLTAAEAALEEHRKQSPGASPA